MRDDNDTMERKRQEGFQKLRLFFFFLLLYLEILSTYFVFTDAN